jgi:tetratricopeptide (TPR) repeat protein
MVESAPDPQEAKESLEGLVKRLESLIAADRGTDTWIKELSVAADRAKLSIAQLRSIATNLTWIDRRLAHPVPTESSYCGDSGIGGLLHLYTCGQRLRFDFNFSGLSIFLDSHRDLPHIEDALVQSFGAFAKLGARAPGAVDQLKHTLGLEDLDFRARHVCLAGLWSAHTLPEQAVLLLELANEMIGLGEADSNVYFRRAAAYRMMGKFSEALDDIDRALTLLAPGNNEIHQDYLRERQLIGVAFQSYPRRDI